MLKASTPKRPALERMSACRAELREPSGCILVPKSATLDELSKVSGGPFRSQNFPRGPKQLEHIRQSQIKVGKQFLYSPYRGLYARSLTVKGGEIHIVANCARGPFIEDQ